MKIEATIDPIDNNSIRIVVSGTPGDKKQPLDFIYSRFDLTPAAAKRLAAQLTKLTGGAA